MVQALRRLQQRELPEGPQELEALCDLCGTTMPEDHRHLLQLDERRHRVRVRELLGAALRRPGVPARPARASCGSRTSTCPTSSGRASGSRSGSLSSCARRDDGRRALPEPGRRDRVGARPGCVGRAWPSSTRSLETLESDAEALVVNRLADPPQYAIAPTDQAYRLVGLVKASWQGISGGPELESAVAGFFDELRAQRAPSRSIAARARARGCSAPSRSRTRRRRRCRSRCA